MFKRCLSFLLAVVMVISMLPVYASAEETASEEIPAAAETGTTAPPTEATEETEPKATLPEESIPKDSIPVESVPEESVPEETVPGESVPEETVPGESVPEDSIPEDVIPGESVPGEAMLTDGTTLAATGNILGNGRCGSNVNFELTMGGTLTISGTGRMWNYTSSTVPWYNFQDDIDTIVVEEGVTCIGNYAFAFCSNVTSVSLPDTLTEIGSSAFSYCRNLRSISLPYGLVYIREYAFSYCSNLTGITLHEDVTTLETGAFVGCTRLESAQMSYSKITSIPYDAFRDCTALRTVTIPETLQRVGVSAFENSAIRSFSFHSKITEIGESAFRNCSYLTIVEIPASVKTIGSSAFQGCGTNRVTIYSSAVSMGTNVFSACSYLNSVTFPEGFSHIPSGTFLGCSSLSTVTLPKELTSIGSSAFEGCTNLSGITLPANLQDIGNRAFYGCEWLYNITFPGTLRRIGDYAFYGCEHLSAISVPESVTYIGKYAFAECTWMETAELSASIPMIQDGTFHHCTHLETVNIPGTVKAIYHEAFGYCTNLRSLVIPCGVENYSAYIFTGCSTLLTLTVLKGSAAEEFANEVGIRYVTCTHPNRQSVPGKEATCAQQGNIAHIHCPVCDVRGEDYNFTNRLSRSDVFFLADHTPVHVEAAASSCFEDGNIEHWICSVCSTIWLNEDLTSVSSADKVVVPAAHTTSLVKGSAPTTFQDGLTKHWHCSVCDGYWLDSALTQPTTPEALVIPATGILASGTFNTTIQWTLMTSGELILSGTGAVETSGTYPWTSRSSNIHNITVSDGITTIGEGAFMNLTAAVSISLPDTLTFIGNKAFRNCYALESIAIPNGVTHIGSSAFANCKNLTSVTLPDSVTCIVSSTFANCTALTTIALPDGITDIGYYAFEGCQNLSEIHLPDSLTQIFSNAFMNCTSLNHIDLPKNLEYLDNHVFIGCTALENIQIPSKITSLHASIFENCTSLTTVSFPVGFRTIGQAAFKNCTSLTSLDFPYALTSIGVEAFMGCTGLSRVELPESITQVNSRVFSGCDNLTHVEIPASLKAIYTEAFRGCTKLKTLAIPYSVEEIDETAFDQCDDLTLLVLRNSPAERIAREQNMAYRVHGNRAEDAIQLSFTRNEKGTGASCTVTVQPGSWYYWGYITYMILKANGQVIDVFSKPPNSNVFCLVNPTDELMTFQLEAAYPLGSSLNPEDMVPGENSVTLNAGIRGGYYFTWTPEKDGVLTITMLSETWIYKLYSDSREFTEGFWKSDKNSANNPASFHVSAGEELELIVKTYNPSSSQYPAGTVSFRMDFEEQVKPALRLVPVVRAPAEMTMYDPDGNVTDKTYRAVDYLVCLNKADVEDGAHTFRISPEGWTAQGSPRTLDPKKLKWSTSDSRIATVKDGIVTVIAKTDGACVITLVNSDTKDEAHLSIQVKDYTPRLEGAALTLNTQAVSGTSTGLMASYGNGIREVSLHDYDAKTKTAAQQPSGSFRAGYNDGTLTITHSAVLKNGTYKLMLKVLCDDGVTYEHLLSVKVANKLPAVTIKQLGKFNTFYTDSTARFQIACKGETIRDATFETESFRGSFNAAEGILTVSTTEAYRKGEAALVAKGTMKIYLAGYTVPVQKTVTLSTEKKAPRLALSETASTVNTALAGTPATSFRVCHTGSGETVAPESIRTEAAFATGHVDESGLVTMTLTGKKGGTVNVFVQEKTWTAPVKLTHKITVQTKLPALKLSASKVTLNTVFTDQPGVLHLSLDQKNLAIGKVTWVSTAKKDAQLQEVNKLLAEVSGNTITFRLDPENLPKKGTYSIKATAFLQDGTELAAKTFKIAVEDKVPAVKLKTATLKLNRKLGTHAYAVTPVTLPKGVADYQVVSFEAASRDVAITYDAATCELKAALVNPDAAIGKQTVSLYPVLKHLPTGQLVALKTPLKLTAQIYEGKPAVTVKAAGKLDPIVPGSAITYTITKLTNIAGEATAVRLEGTGAEKFNVKLQDGKAVLTLKEGVTYQKNAKFKLNLVYAIAGQEVPVPVTVTLTQSPLKLASVRPLNLYQSNSRLNCVLTITAPAGAKIGSITLGAKTPWQFRYALGGNDGVTFTERADSTLLVSFRVRNPAFLTYGKSYTVYLDVLPEGNAANAAPTSLKLTVKTFK